MITVTKTLDGMAIVGASRVVFPLLGRCQNGSMRIESRTVALICMMAFYTLITMRGAKAPKILG